MKLWKIEPVARAGDPRWLNHPRFARVIVRAETAGEARLLAAAQENPGAPSAIGNESHGDVTGLADEKLYRIAPLPDEERGALAVEGGPAVLSRRRDEG
ncbi:MAG: hypothetical protein RIB45_11375 [Marivibrio sp.]|uniref:hypothetical protein n=1 Tax=Marivibrio sp. TaxID=2039719 RepID=UPI0032EAE1C3